MQIKSKIPPSEVRVAHSDAVGDTGYSNTEGKITRTSPMERHGTANRRRIESGGKSWLQNYYNCTVNINSRFLEGMGMEKRVFHSLLGFANYRLKTKLSGTVSLPVIVTSWFCVPRVSCQAVIVYLPGGRLLSEKAPLSPVTE